MSWKRLRRKASYLAGGPTVSTKTRVTLIPRASSLRSSSTTAPCDIWLRLVGSSLVISSEISSAESSLFSNSRNPFARQSSMRAKISLRWRSLSCFESSKAAPSMVRLSASKLLSREYTPRMSFQVS